MSRSKLNRRQTHFFHFFQGLIIFVLETIRYREQYSVLIYIVVTDISQLDTGECVCPNYFDSLFVSLLYMCLNFIASLRRKRKKRISGTKKRFTFSIKNKVV